MACHALSAACLACLAVSSSFSSASVTAVLRRGGKLCPAKKMPQRNVKLKASPDAKQTLSQMDIENAPMRAESNEPKVGESFAEKQILWFQMVARRCTSMRQSCRESVHGGQAGPRIWHRMPSKRWKAPIVERNWFFLSPRCWINLIYSDDFGPGGNRRYTDTQKDRRTI